MSAFEKYKIGKLYRRMYSEGVWLLYDFQDTLVDSNGDRLRYYFFLKPDGTEHKVHPARISYFEPVYLEPT